MTSTQTKPIALNYNKNKCDVIHGRLKRSADVNLTKETHQNIHWLDRKIVYPIQPTILTSSYYLRHKLREKGLHTLRVTNDADVIIVKTAILKKPLTIIL